MKASSDIRALLLTDVVGSTELAARVGDSAAAEMWIAHDRVARDLLPRHAGREIDKTDGMLLLFDDAAQALSCALAYHAGIAALGVPLQARAGLHVGSVLLRENTAEDVARGAKPLEVEGLAKPTAARVMGLARGGQTLLSAEAAQTLEEPAGAWRLRSHGHWALKGLNEPTEIFEAAGPGQVFVAPQGSDKAYRVGRVGERWLPATEIANNLPAQRTSFVGRESELDDIKSMLGEAPLITLTGMGGLGKTRLALQVAREVLPQFPDGVWFVDLSPITEPAWVPAEVARVLEVFDEPGRTLLDTLRAWLKPRRLLLVLDNCEHLLEAAGDLVNALLHDAPGLRVLASSRELLDLPGEQVYPILPLPAPRRGDDAQALLRSPSVRLLAERARAQRPDFDLEAEDASQLAELVQQLEGIPLAIELAAARLRTLSLAEILDGLKDRFALLTGGSRVLQRRQQTLRSLVDWSYELLGAQEQRLFGRLAVFRCGFEAADAAAICAGEPVAQEEVEALLGALADKSLLLREASDEGQRHRMLTTIRDYAAQRLQAQGEAPAFSPRATANTSLRWPSRPAAASGVPNRRAGCAGWRTTLTTCALLPSWRWLAVSMPSSR